MSCDREIRLTDDRHRVVRILFRREFKPPLCALAAGQLHPLQLNLTIRAEAEDAPIGEADHCVAAAIDALVVPELG